jgi:ABC-2 type transport system ATP-binding protein
MANSSFSVQVSGLTKRFPGVTAVDDLSFSVVPGEIFGLVGSDGAGKSTTLRMLAGVLPADEGSAMVAGFDMIGDPEPAKPHISYMPQSFGLYQDLTVYENIRFYADLFGIGRRQREERATRLLAASGMSEFRGRLAGQLSGGMKQKLGLTCALIHTPRVLLLDEPTTGVDPVSRRDFWRLLYHLLAEGVTMLISTAYLDEAERCHRLALLHLGRLLFCDTPAGIKSRLPGAVIAVISPRPREVRQELDQAPGVSSLVLVGDGVHLVVDDAARRLSELRQRLQAAGLPFEQIAQTTPTIEDVFVASVQAQQDCGDAGTD